MLKILAPARVHLSLIDMSESGYRKNGSIGFAISRKNILLIAKKSIDTKLDKIAVKINEQNTLEQLKLIIRNTIQKFNLKYSIEIEHIEIPYQHMGFGSGTSLRLSVLEALFILNDYFPSKIELMQASGRGGASGIGINTYFNGGFVFDLGVKKNNEIKFQSSDEIIYPEELPIVLKRINMPMWNMAILVPNDVSPITLENERLFFSKNTPQSQDDVNEITYHALFGTTASIIDNDYNYFCKSINSIQQCSWKKAEVALHGDSLGKYIHYLKDIISCDAIAMSSFGPNLLIIDQNIEEKCQLIKEKFPDSDIFLTSPDNHGRVIEHA
ncbi:beta-ribofuranosylaminobenzene 5'-phosphate synthase family protein [Aquitalea denitrificans]|uniref:beta-ribofuranosylaminobenzene 5'-phosphate synthase family protein n=1 Tax=Aquitalea denitrificans TaxID=519081 RepID=UPI00135B53C8|nr:beta-ribofuranosylaminobenzene 5'-phosphate synthase family protein [Aquitalea denitrificans]